MTKKPRQSIVSSFSALATESEAAAPEQKMSQIPIGRVPPRVAAGIVGATQRTLTDIREERDRLQAQVAAGGGLEIDPGLVDPSPFQDRLPDDDAAAMEALRRSMLEEGQKVPVEVRRHPAAEGRFQLVYGHRRWRAAKAQGLRLKAIVVDLDDRELAIAQGLENSARQDLSWIEKGLFAWRMEQARVRARDIRAALGVDDAELARFRQVCRVLGLPLIEAIGRAPRAGRPRWLEIAGHLQVRPEIAASLLKTLAAAKHRTSDERFALALAAFARPAPARPPSVTLQDGAGRTVGHAEFDRGAIRLTLDKQDAEAFAVFFRDALPELMRRFRSVGHGH